MSSSPNLYEDVLDRIFSFVSGEYEERLRTLARASRVCCSWRPVGQSWLFRLVALCTTTKNEKALQVLQETLNRCPRLASLVRALDIWCKNSEEEECFWEIVRVCPELHGVKLYVRQDVKIPESRDMWKALEGKPKITSLWLWGTPSEGRFTIDELLWFMATNLHQIESFLVWNGWIVPSNKEKSINDARLFHGCRLDHLRKLDLGWDIPLGADSLQLLHSCAPNITKFEARIEDDEVAYARLEDCLALWSPNLEYLSLTTGQHPKHISLSFPRLMRLNASARVIAPLTLHHCPILEWLTYTLSAQSDLEELKSILVRTQAAEDGAGLAMPVLQKLFIYRDRAANVDIDGPSVRALIEACNARGVDVTNLP